MAILTQLDMILPYGDSTYVETPVSGSTSQIISGTRAFDASGNEYVWGAGVASTIVGSLVSFDLNFNSALLINGAVGLVGVAQGAIVVLTYGWYMVKGTAATAQTADTTLGGLVYTTATAGKLSNTSTAQIQVKNAFSGATTTGSKVIGTTVLSYPTIGI